MLNHRRRLLINLRSDSAVKLKFPVKILDVNLVCSVCFRPGINRRVTLKRDFVDRTGGGPVTKRQDGLGAFARYHTLS